MRPEIAMFFTNHVASSMHRFWPATFPEDYSKPFWDETWASKWNGEIPFAMGEADLQIRDLMKFVESDQRYALVVVTSMGQAAVDLGDLEDDVGAVVAAAGIVQAEVLLRRVHDAVELGRHQAGDT